MSLMFNLNRAESELVLPNLSLYMESGIVPAQEMTIVGEEMANTFSQLGQALVVLVDDYDSAEKYKEKVASANEKIYVLVNKTEFDYKPISSPLFLPYDLEKNKIKIKEVLEMYALKDENGKFLRSSRDEVTTEKNQDNKIQHFVYDEKLLNLVNKINEIGYNHFSPYLVNIYKEICRVFPKLEESGQIDLPQMESLATSVMSFADKASYVNKYNELTKEEQKSLPKHVETRLITPDIALNIESFDELVDIMGLISDKFFVKHAEGSGGHLAEIISRDTFEEKWPKLMNNYKNSELVKSKADFLVQEVISSDSLSPLPNCYGITFYVSSVGKVEVESIQSQSYKDKNKLSFFGSYWDKQQDALVRQQINEEKLKNFGEFIYKRSGLYGTYNIDMMYDYSIFDLNARATGAFSMLAIKEFISQDIELEQLMNLGYGGGQYKFNDLEDSLQLLEKENLLATRQNPKGIFLLPSIFPKEVEVSYDAFLVNVPQSEIAEYYQRFIALTDNFDSINQKTIYI